MDPGWDMSELFNLEESISLQEYFTAIVIIISG
jgi:hypothetical protein